MLVTLSGMGALVKLVQRTNALNQMLVTLLGIVTCYSWRFTWRGRANVFARLSCLEVSAAIWQLSSQSGSWQLERRYQHAAKLR